jgi:hypothetical protein
MRPVIRWLLGSRHRSIYHDTASSFDGTSAAIDPNYSPPCMHRFLQLVARLLSMYPHVHSLRRWIQDIIRVLRPVSGATRDQSPWHHSFWPQMLPAVDFLFIYQCSARLVDAWIKALCHLLRH